MRRRGERPGHSATTAHFQAAYPFLGMGGIGAPGAYVGTDAFGGAWSYDPWELYARRTVRSPNLIVMGEIAHLKSTLIKTFLFRQYVFGRQFWILDVKGEYGPFAEALGYRTIKLEPGGEVRLNAIERRGGREGQLALLRAVAMAALHRRLAPEEDAVLRVALDQVNEEAGAGEPTLPRVVEVLLHPREAMVAAVAAEGTAEFAGGARECALALQRLCEGDLRGMFDGPTSEGIDLDAGLVVLDLSAMRDSEALGILMTCAGAWQQAIFRERRAESERTGIPMRKTYCVFEEVWRVAADEAVAEWLQLNFKLCRAYAISNILSLHKLTDFGTAGADGSRAARIAVALVGDAGCVVIFRQPPDQQQILREVLGCSDTEVELAGRLEIGESIWKMGRHSMLVRLRMSRRERAITFTDEQMGAGVALGAS